MVKRTSVIKWGFSSVVFQKQTVVCVGFYIAACTVPLFNKSQSGVPSLFDGYGIGYLNIMNLLRFLILQMMPLYIIGVGISTTYDKNILFRVRLLRSSEWQKALEATLLGITGGFCSLRLACSLLSKELSNINILVHGRAIFLCYFLAILESFASALLFVNLYTRLRSATGVFLILFFLYFGVALLPFHYYPFGLSSYSRVQMLSPTVDGSYRIAFIYLIVIVFFLHVWLWSGVRKYLRS